MFWSLLIPAIVGAIVTALLTLAWRLTWKHVLIPIGEAATAVARLADVVTATQLLPEINEYLHRRMHDILNSLAAIQLSQATLPEMVLKLGEAIIDLQQVVEEAKTIPFVGPATSHPTPPASSS